MLLRASSTRLAALADVGIIVVLMLIFEFIGDSRPPVVFPRRQRRLSFARFPQEEERSVRDPSRARVQTEDAGKGKGRNQGSP